MSARRKSTTTIDDIGRELGISAMTVSRALNGHPDVRDETRQSVLVAAKRLNYRPNRWARSLVTKKSHVIGIVVPDISHSFFSEITRVVQETIEPRGYGLMLCHTHADADREQAAIDMLLGSCVDGLLVASSRPAGDPGFYVDLLADPTPIVFFDRYFPDLDCARVHTDDFEVGRIATQHLIDLGHRRIAFIRGPEVTTGQQRFEGYRSALERYRETWVVPGHFDFDSGYAAMKLLLARNEGITAVFAGNDPAAFGAIRACREAGLEVPRDVSVVGAGSIEGPYHPNPFLTTVDWSRKDLGRKGTEMLLHAIEQKTTHADEPFVAEPALVLRHSTARAQL